MNPHSKRHLHLGVNFLIAPAPALSAEQQLAFQSALARGGIVFDAMQRQEPAVQFARQSEPLQVRIGPVAPQVGQLLVTAPQPNRLVEEFVQDAELVVNAFQAVWNTPYQVIRRDSTVRHLYAVREPHAFLFLWERRLHQPSDSLSAFGRPVLGGGLRIVMPARPDIEDDPQVEVKIESLLTDASQLFVETSFVWDRPSPDGNLEPAKLVSAVESFMNSEVKQFILAES